MHSGSADTNYTFDDNTVAAAEGSNQSSPGTGDSGAASGMTLRSNQGRVSRARGTPAGLQTLILGDGFLQSLDAVDLPAGLQTLTFGKLFSQRLDGVTPPEGLQVFSCHRGLLVSSAT